MTHTIRATPVFLFTMIVLVCGCAGPEIFDQIAAPENADVAETPYPRLADVSEPGPGPNPAEGDAVRIELGVAASEAETRLESVSGPVK